MEFVCLFLFVRQLQTVLLWFSVVELFYLLPKHIYVIAKLSM
jgi:hypothetical protein